MTATTSPSTAAGVDPAADRLDGAIAIVGMSGRFPEARSVGEFWTNLVQGARSIRPLTDDELRAIDPAVRANPGFVPVTASVPDVDRWDAPFFGYDPADAALIDPQHRLFLECAWEALEDSGYDPRGVPGVVGVVGGSGFPTYLLNNIATGTDLSDLAVLQLAIGNERDSLTTKVSYALDLRGPSYAVQSSCSTSLLAVHLACQSLLTFESDMMLAGGAAITFPQSGGYISEPAPAADEGRGAREHLALAPDGVCRSLDSGGGGLVPGNGVAVVALKRWSDARRDGDHVYALIVGSATNNDGSARVGYAAPGLRGQVEVMSEGLAVAGVPAHSIGYLEAHGSGTLLGDSIELDAVGRAFAGRPAGAAPCVLGSSKPNLGHLDRASGVAGLIKTALMLQHRVIPGQIDFATPNPALDLTRGDLRVVTATEPWRSTGDPRRAAVNSFGLGGTNAFVVLEETPADRRADTDDTVGAGPQALLLSARTPDALREMTARLRDHLVAHPCLRLADVAFTLRAGRTEFNHRRAMACRDLPDAIDRLTQPESALVRTSDQTGRDRPIGLWVPDPLSSPIPPEMITGLRKAEPEFAEAFDRCRYALGDSPGGTPVRRGDSSATAALYALGWLLLARGLQPVSIAGDGTGQRIAACLSGRRSLGSLADGPTEDAAVEMSAAFAAGSLVVELAGGGPREVAGGLAVLAAIGVPGPGDADLAVADLFGRLWLAGGSAAIAPAVDSVQPQRVSLPTYPFARERCWVEPHRGKAMMTTSTGATTDRSIPEPSNGAYSYLLPS